MKNLVNFDSVLSLIDKTLSPTYLSPTQEIVLREVWNGKTYSKMACDYNYDPEYIKSVGCNLWQTLSRAFDEQITKSNFVPFMRQKITQLTDETKSQLVERQDRALFTELEGKPICHWTTAPNIKNFVGREEEIKKLDSWSQEPDCRCIIVSGMVGCGKTTLVTKLAREIKDRYDYVVWVSLEQTPPLTTLLNNYLKLMHQQLEDRSEPKYSELNFLLSEFIYCLQQRKILLVIDGLECVLQVSKANIYFKQEFEDYGQLLRSVVSTNHQSLLISTTRVRPKLLEYYGGNQAVFLELQGLNPENTKMFFDTQNNIQLNEQKILFFSEILQYNPQFLKIVNNHLDDFSENNIEQTIEEISMLEVIVSLLKLELSCLSDLEHEIIYWLAILSSSSVKELSYYIKQTQGKFNFSQSVNCLVKRSLVIKNDDTYVLMPIMKSYLRRQLVEQALRSQHHNRSI